MPRITREDARKYLADVPPEYVFYCHDSCVFKNMKELRDGLANMADEVYTYHANSEKNDFSQWVKDIIKDEQLAVDLQSARSKSDAAGKVSSRIVALSRR